jgi:hypothetical protein
MKKYNLFQNFTVAQIHIMQNPFQKIQNPLFKSSSYAKNKAHICRFYITELKN